jgi:hypothetical protein
MPAALAIVAAAVWLATKLAMRAEVRGPSMAPALHDGDRVLVNAFAYRTRAPRTGEVVLASMPGVPGRWAIKRIGAQVSGDPSVRDSAHGRQRSTARSAGLYFLIGDNPHWSTDSRHLGPVPQRDILGRVWYRYWPPERRGRVL